MFHTVKLKVSYVKYYAILVSKLKLNSNNINEICEKHKREVLFSFLQYFKI